MEKNGKKKALEKCSEREATRTIWGENKKNGVPIWEGNRQECKWGKKKVTRASH